VYRETYRRSFAILECIEDAVELELAVDVILLLLDVDGLVDISSHGESSRDSWS
jgi:hypothetical protein